MGAFAAINAVIADGTSALQIVALSIKGKQDACPRSASRFGKDTEGRLEAHPHNEGHSSAMVVAAGFQPAARH